MNPILKKKRSRISTFRLFVKPILEKVTTQHFAAMKPIVDSIVSVIDPFIGRTASGSDFEKLSFVN